MSQPITDIAAHIAAPVAESAEPTKLRVEEGAVPVNSVAVAVAEDAGVPPPPGTAEPVPLPNAEGATQPTAPATPPKTTTPSAATVLLATTVPPSVTPTATEAELAQPAHTPPHPNAKVAALQAELARLKNELGDADADAIVQRHIRLLHTYNEIKDGAQALIGRVGEDAQADADTRQYALLTNTTVTGVHRELGLSLHE